MGNVIKGMMCGDNSSPLPRDPGALYVDNDE